MSDIRYALRLMRRAPGFTLVAITTLAIGIGANTAIFSIVYALLLRPMPYPDAGRLVTVWQDMRARGGPAKEWATPGNYVDWKADTAIFAGVTAVSGWAASLSGVGEPEPLVGEQVTPEYFDVLGARPALGRAFRPEDGLPDAHRVVIISDGLWARRFGRDPAVIGRMVTLSGEPHEIVGVAPAGFRPGILAAATLWRPQRMDMANPSRGAVILRVIARLRPGISLAEASSGLATLARQLERAYPRSNTRVSFAIVPLRDQVVGDVRPALLVLLGAVGLVLLIACVNVANLLLARAARRAREIAVRRALGAGRLRVVRQLLTESVLLAAAGGAGGVLLGLWGVAALIAIAPAGVPRLNEVHMDRTVLAFATLLIGVTGVLFGLAPAWHASRDTFAPALKEGGRGTAGAAGSKTRRALIVAEVALALVLLVGGGLLLRTFLQLQRVDLGFDPDGVVVGTVNPTRQKYDTPKALTAFYDRLLESAAALPGVKAAALSSVIPVSGGDSDVSFEIEGRPAPATDAEVMAAWYRLVSADYLKTMGIALRSGRVFGAHEAEPVIVVNETMARKFWPGENPIGRRIRSDPRQPWFTIIGIVGDVKVRGAARETEPEMYIPYWQAPEPGIAIVLETTLDPEALGGPMKRMVQSIDPDMPVSRIASMRQLAAESIQQARFSAMIVGLFAAIALMLAAVGIYGVMSYLVAQRTAEIGVRLALGAAERQIFGLVIGDALRLTAIGVAAGAVGALVLEQGMQRLLFGVHAADPLTFVSTAAVLVAVAAAATYIPARRAMRVNPIDALRAE